MDSMRTRVQELERECSTMKKAIQKIDKVSKHSSGNSGEEENWRKFRCIDSRLKCVTPHEPTVVEAGKGECYRGNLCWTIQSSRGPSKAQQLPSHNASK
ncbi:hypothetical protein HAX54_046951 [Datura stramonium]|uniref:Uncharacterized protein n=1 Tax=Datura stramonium TaxID=4076 RepID=A0ABS8RPW4_DATST|nr:hypothetical protein [Datura stramonium]